MQQLNSVDTSPDTHTCLTERVVVRTSEIPWHPSPSTTVVRKSLYREGGEMGPVTSIVRYAMDSQFPAHTHPGGEEILVLEGVFSDEHGDYPAGTYLLNPVGSRHAPFSKQGCVLFVHLRQYAGHDRNPLAIDTNKLTWQPSTLPGIATKLLYAQLGYPEKVSLEQWQAGAARTFAIGHAPTEFYVLEGSLQDEDAEYPAMTWLRIPSQSSARHFYSKQGCTFYLKLQESPA